jgi:hypothetical protein
MLATTTSVSCEIKSNNLTDGGSYRSGSGGTNPIQLILNNENPFVAVIIQYRVVSRFARDRHNRTSFLYIHSPLNLLDFHS